MGTGRSGSWFRQVTGSFRQRVKNARHGRDGAGCRPYRPKISGGCRNVLTRTRWVTVSPLGGADGVTLGSPPPLPDYCEVPPPGISRERARHSIDGAGCRGIPADDSGRVAGCRWCPRGGQNIRPGRGADPPLLPGSESLSGRADRGCVQRVYWLFTI